MATLNEFIERGMSFFSGETVSKHELEKASDALGVASAALAETKATLASTQEALTQTQADLATSKKTIQTLTASVSSKEEEISALRADRKTVSQTAVELVAAQGVPASAAPAAQASTSPEIERAAVLKEYNQLIDSGKSMEAGQFYQTNRKLIRGW